MKKKSFVSRFCFLKNSFFLKRNFKGGKNLRFSKSLDMNEGYEEILFPKKNFFFF